VVVIAALDTTTSISPNTASSSASFATSACRSQPGATSSVTTSKPSSRSRSVIATPIPRAAPVTSARRARSAFMPDRPVALPVAVWDRVGILVPVRGARIGGEILRRIGRIERESAPLDRELLVHERAVGAVQREALAAVGPVVRRARAPVAGRLVQALAHEPLAGAARVHRERDLLVILGDREAARVLADAGAGVRAPGRREQLDDRAPVEPVDRVVVAPPALRDRLLPGLLDALVPELVLDDGDQAEDRLGHQVVQHQPLVLHRLAQP